MYEDSTFVRTEPAQSPLDPFLCEFLRAVEALHQGYAPATHRQRMTSSLEWPLEFADAILASAQARGLVEPTGRGTTGQRTRWRVSARGRIWLEMADSVGSAPIDPDPFVSASATSI